MAAILPAGRKFVKCRIFTYKKYPAYAVYRWVLNLLAQVVSYWETPPWLRPIA